MNGVKNIISSSHYEFFHYVAAKNLEFTEKECISFFLFVVFGVIKDIVYKS